ncbi:hypothetical protein LN325_002238 [Staphylococcus pseudintermedius]|nr:hypothetical protein [Staphylococcus pseudintermedius]
MAKIAWIIPVERVLNNEHGDVVFDSPITQLALEAFPNNYTFSIAFGIIDLNPKIPNEIKFKMGVESNEHEVLSDLSFTIENNLSQSLMAAIDNELIEYSTNINLNNFRFPIPGIYFIELEIDENRMKINFKVTNKGV